MGGWTDLKFHPPSWPKNDQIISSIKTLRGDPVQVFECTGRETEAWGKEGRTVRPSQEGTRLSVPCA